MERENILREIRASIEEAADIPQSEIREDSAMMDDLDLSSMEIMTLLAELEDKFDLRIPESELRSFVTVGDLADYLAAHQNG